MEQRDTPTAAPPDMSEDPFRDMTTARAVVNRQGIVTEWNEGAHMLLGYTSQEVLGRSAARLLGENITAKTLAEIQGLPRWSGRVRLRHRDGQLTAASVIAHHLVEGDANVNWLLVSPLTGTSAAPEDETLALWSFEQSTSCDITVYDTHLRLRRANHRAQSVMDLSEAEMRGLRATEIVTHPHVEQTEQLMAKALETGQPQYMENFVRAPGEPRVHVWSVFVSPLQEENVIRGVCVTAHDMTEQYWARKRLQLLDDASTRIGSTLDVTRTAEELAGVIVPEIADFATIDLLPDPEPQSHPVQSEPTGLRRITHKSVTPGTPEAAVALGELLTYLPHTPVARSLASGRGVLLANYDPQNTDLSLGNPRQDTSVRAFGMHSIMVVPIRARGATLGCALFARHRRPDPFSDDDLLLAQELTARAAVSIDNARRYTRERKTAVALQRTLLPQRLPQQAALDVASRYLPTGAVTGVGGDWFDVIPLSGARVAMVVGDVVGHGIHASAAMGRLRTAVRTLADVDLAPDELLTHLDDMVLRLSAEADDDSADSGTQPDQRAVTAGGFGATCLYAVYDPVSRVCTLARAGHPGPAAVSPEGTVDLLDVPAGPPLGLGGLPFENVEVTLPEGSLLVMYTDGLIESRTQDIDQGIARLRRTLTQAFSSSLEDLCNSVIAAVPPENPTDDIALLIARTHALDARHVAKWDLQADPAVVSQARRLVADQLTEWNLDEEGFVTELVVSELVTNAIRYAAPPIELRLIYDRNLICEVSDASSTAPHLRRARTYDEGGRGLLLVAQLTQAWGTRYGNGTGKTIWAEQTLDDVHLAH
ncbi:SpoIIE family protein phosphatase [Streptomyces sp. NPDC059881]|uniref:SpoIIE family protein phosphatase n=1 Tax=Streptomyces sp. NPDC059881 TaxID=3346986 RepID=UPI00365CA868